MAGMKTWSKAIWQRWDRGRNVTAYHAIANQRAEVTIETEQMLIVRKLPLLQMSPTRGTCSRVWCAGCGRETYVVQAEILKGMSVPRLSDAATTEKWHCFEGEDGTVLVCLESLLKAM
jgi:hypothetical protein